MIEIDAKKATADITRISKHFDDLVPALQDNIINAVNPFTLQLMQRYEPARYITRKQAYGRTFQTKRQQRWFFWALSSGIIDVPYKRTMGMKKAWRIIGSGRGSKIVNDTEAAKYTVGDDTQSRHENLVGWKVVSERLYFARKDIAKKAQAAAREVTLAFNRGDDPRTVVR